MFTLRELVDDGRLGLTILHLGDAGQDARVRTAVISDLLNPSPYLSPGALILTGMAWDRSRNDCVRYVTNIKASGISAVAAGEATGMVPERFVAACAEAGITVLSVDARVSFTTIADHVNDRHSRARIERLTMTLARQRRLLSAVARGIGLDEALEPIADRLGVGVWVITAAGRIVAGVNAGSALPGDILRQIFTASRMPIEHDGYTILRVGSGLSPRTSSWYVVVASGIGDMGREMRELIDEIVSVAAIDREFRRRDRSASRKAVAEFAVLLGEGAEPEVLKDALAGIPGMDETGSGELTIIVAESWPGGPDEELLEAFEAVGVAGPASDGSVVGVSTRSRAEVSRMLESLRSWSTALDGALCIGVGGSSDSSAPGGAYRMARAAADRSRMLAAGSPGVHVRDSAAPTSALDLIRLAPDETRVAFASDLLGPIDRADGARSGNLRETLEAFLDHGCSWSATAEALHVHQNTVRYRIARVEELTGRNLADLGDRFDFYVALKG